MRYRKLDADGDYSFGHGPADFHINTPAAVGQSVLTKLRLLEGEWFLDVTEGTPWMQSVLGTHHQALYDSVIRQRVLDTLGVTGITDYTSSLARATRALSISLKIDTQFGQVQIDTVLGAN